MAEHALDALGALIEPMRLLALFTGMLVGAVFGMLPGLGGVAAVSILLPFVYSMDNYSGLAMLLGAVSVVYTSDTITSVLIGAPGSPASAPTAMEGHALAKQGQAATALGVGFLASMVGGLVGAVILFGAIPIAGPIVLLLGTPELFMFALVGLFYASSMLGKDLAKGLASACFGILLGVVGPAQAAADFRFTFGQVYLLDGFSLTIVALGLFGVAEVIAMLASGGGIAHARVKVTHWGAGFAEFWKARFLVLRSAVIGVFGGFVPAVGASASTWVAYGHAIRSTKDRSRFGKGEIRGVAAAEGANNATVISDLVPTLLFSVPGGPAAAIFLGALFSFGYYPGPRMITQNPDLMFLMCVERRAHLGGGGRALLCDHPGDCTADADPVCHHRRAAGARDGGGRLSVHKHGGRHLPPLRPRRRRLADEKCRLAARARSRRLRAGRTDGAVFLALQPTLRLVLARPPRRPRDRSGDPSSPSPCMRGGGFAPPARPRPSASRAPPPRRPTRASASSWHRSPPSPSPTRCGR